MSLPRPAPLNLVCFAHRAGDDFNRRLLERLNQSGKLYLTHTVLNGRYTLRLCVGQTYTEAVHVQQAWERIQQNAKSLAAQVSQRARASIVYILLWVVLHQDLDGAAGLLQGVGASAKRAIAGSGLVDEFRIAILHRKVV